MFYLFSEKASFKIFKKLILIFMNQNVPQYSLSLQGGHVCKFSKVSQVVVVEKTSLNAILGDDRDTATSTAATVTVDGKRHALLHQLDTFLLAHTLTVVSIHESIEVCAARTTNGSRLADKGSTDGYGVDLTPLVLVPAGNNDSSRKLKNKS